jgi:hypothetical protein
MRKFKAVSTFTRLSIVEKASFCRNVIIKMTNNVMFSAPDVPLEEALEALNAFDAAIIAAKDGGHTAISIRNGCEKVVDEKFILLARYVDRIAEGDETTILSSGFNLSRQPSTPTKETLTATNSIFPGSLNLKRITVANAGSYRWQIRLAGTTEWITYVSTQSSIVISDLTVGAVYEIQVAAVTSEGQQPFSQVVTKLVV